MNSLLSITVKKMHLSDINSSFLEVVGALVNIHEVQYRLWRIDIEVYDFRTTLHPRWRVCTNKIHFIVWHKDCARPFIKNAKQAVRCTALFANLTSKSARCSILTQYS